MIRGETYSQLALRLGAALLCVLLAVEAAQGQATGTFPPEPYDGMQITYTVSGVEGVREEDMGTSRIMRGRLGQGELRVSGTARVPWAGRVSVTVRAGTLDNEFIKRDSRGQTSFTETPPPIEIPFDVAVPIGTTAANGEFHISVNKDILVGRRMESRSVGVAGFLSMTGPAPKADALASLDRLLERYRQKISRGPKATGIINNGLSWFFGVQAKDEVGDPIDLEKEFSCGAYQRKVLAFLDGLRFSQDPAERALLTGWEYGPIQAWFGGHQAVALYRTGTGWLDEGNFVLDPWPNQKPEHWPVGVWTAKFTILQAGGIGGSEAYENGNYPTVGGQYLRPQDKATTTVEEAWVRTLPKDIQDALAAMRTTKAEARVRWIKTHYARRHLNTRVIAQCPVELFLTDAQGRVSGFVNGQFKNEIPRVRMLRLPDEKGGWWTQVEFPREDLAGSRAPLSLRGTAAGTSTILVGYNAENPGAQAIDAYQLPVVAGQVSVLQKLEAGAILLSAGQRILPERPTTRLVNGVRELVLPSTPTVGPVAAAPAIERTLFSSENAEAVTNNPPQPAIFELNETVRLTLIRTYHWNNGQGTPPGFIELLDANGKPLGRWIAELQNRYFWNVKPNIVLKPGTYQVRDSSPATWAHNAASGNRGFICANGIALRATGETIAPPATAPPATAPPLNVAGVYTTAWGDMTLHQTGTTVKGTFAHKEGQIAGILSGTVLTGRWTQAPTHLPPNDAGDLRFTFDAKGTSFTGVWRYGSTGEMTAVWNGTRK